MNIRGLQMAGRIPKFSISDDPSGGDTGGDTGGDDGGDGDGVDGDDGGDIVRPDWLPEKFWDAEAKQPNIENLAKSYGELEKNRVNPDKLKEQWEQERLASRPEAPDGYQLPKDDRFDAEALSASPIVELWRAAAHEAGFGQEQFEKTLVAYADQEVQRIQQAAQAEMEALGDTAQDRIKAAEQWASANFKDDEYDAVAQIASTAAGVRVLEKMMKSMKETSPEGFNDSGNFDQDDETTINKLMDSKAYRDSGHPDFHKVKARVDAYYKRKYG